MPMLHCVIKSVTPKNEIKSFENIKKVKGP